MARLPLMLDLRRRRVVVVGGGTIALRKVRRLLAVGARPIVVAPSLDGDLRGLVDDGLVRWFPRPFEARDCRGARLVVAATDVRSVNDVAVRAARRQGCLAVAADRRGGGGLSFAAAIERGDCVVAVGTSGGAPALAAALCRRLNVLLPARWSLVSRAFRRLRRRIKNLSLTMVDEQRVWRELTDGPAIELLLADDRQAFAEEVERCIASSSA